MIKDIRKVLKSFLSFLILVILLSSCVNIRYKKTMNELAIKVESGDYTKAIELCSDLLGTKLSKDKKREVLEIKAMSEFALAEYKNVISTISDINTDKKLNDNLKVILALSLIKEKQELDRAYQLLLNIKSKNEFYDEVLDEFLNIAVLDFSSENIINFDISELKNISEKEYKKEDNLKNTNRLGIFAYIDEDYSKAKEYFDLAYSKIDKSDLSEENTSMIKAVLFNKAATCMHLLEKEEALALLEEYINLYGMDERVEHEYTFIKSRVK